MDIYTRSINIFENYLKIKYNKDNKDIKIYKLCDILSFYYKGVEIITLYSLLCYCINNKNNKYFDYENKYKHLCYFNYKNNKIEIFYNKKTIYYSGPYYNLHKKYNLKKLYSKSYYTTVYDHIFCCKYMYYMYNIYIYNSKIKIKFKKSYNNNYYNYNNYYYKIIIIIFGLYIIIIYNKKLIFILYNI